MRTVIPLSLIHILESDYTFIADSETMKVEVAFTFDATSLDGKQLVTFEELYDLSNPDEPKKVTEHKDIEDKGQTITFKEKTKVPKEPEKPETPQTPDTVSYTHLDVYKRQVCERPCGLCKDEHRMVSRLSFHRGAGSNHEPVSYTHLDVYKRQAMCRCHQRIPDRYRSRAEAG